MLADEVEMYMDVEYFDGEGCDTEITISGCFCVQHARQDRLALRRWRYLLALT